MIEILNAISFWHWIAAGLLLLSVELMGTAGYFLWVGISAILIGIIHFLFPMGWAFQLIFFGVASLITTFLWWRYQYSKDVINEKNSSLNQRNKQLLGQVIRLEQDIDVGKCRINIGDTSWSAVSACALPSGSEVKITKVDGIVVTIEPIVRED